MLVRLKLVKAYGPHPAGAEVEFDPARAARLLKEGYAVDPAAKAKPSNGKARP